MFNIHITIERWKKNGEFYVSNLGRIKRHKKIVKQYVGDGYMYVYGKDKIYSVHRLVAETWLGNIDGYSIDHVDHNKRNNAVKNLVVMNQEENQKLADMDRMTVEYIKFDGKVMSLSEAANMVGGGSSTMRKLKNCLNNGNKIWKYHTIEKAGG